MYGKKIEMLIESTTKIEIFYGYEKVNDGVLCNSVSIVIDDGKCNLSLFVPSEQGTEALEEKISEILLTINKFSASDQIEKLFKKLDKHKVKWASPAFWKKNKRAR